MTSPKSNPVNLIQIGLLNRVMVLVMCACLAVTIQQVLRVFFPHLGWGHLSWVGLLVACESLVSLARLSKGEQINITAGAYWLVEWVVLLLFVKVSTLIGIGRQALLDQITGWQLDFGRFFFDDVFFLTAITAGCNWGLAAWYGHDLQSIEADDRLLNFSNREGLTSDRDATRREMMNRFIWVGLLLVFLTGIARFGSQGSDPGQPGLSNDSRVVLLGYFLAGMVLISQMQLSVLRAGWLWERIPFDLHISQRWVITSILVLGAVAFLALKLPNESMLGLLPTLTILFSWIEILLYIVLTIISIPIFLLIYLMNLLFGPAQRLAVRSPPPRLVLPRQAEQPYNIPWLEALQSVIFWSVLFGVIVYALIQYLRQNRDLVEQVRRLGALRWLGQVWDHLRIILRGAGQGVAALVVNGVERLRAVFQRAPGPGPSHLPGAG